MRLGYNQEKVTNADLSAGAYTTNAQNSADIDEMVTLQTAGNDANSVYYSGISYFPIGVGQVFTIVNQTVEHELIAIEVVHHSQVHGNYTCAFKAIPADVAAPHYTDVKVFAKAESQPAKVIDNNDPDGLGRVKVAFNWAGGTAKSEWMRMIQPHSGAGKGFYFIPEKGEEVLVGFEGGNIQSPYVVGSHYNGSNSSGYADGENNIKAIHTRSGTKIILNDGEGSILIEDPSGNTWMMDGQGNISVNAPKNFTINAGENITFTAGQNITSSATLNISETAGVDKSLTVGAILSTKVGGDSMMNVTGSFMEHIEGNLESHTEKERTSVSKGKIASHSSGTHEHHSDKEIHNNSGEKSKNF